jgi:uncharacterized circularly permuted ATP-grasp superfamily protein/uncharacterized alpha-E superfamily protein
MADAEGRVRALWRPFAAIWSKLDPAERERIGLDARRVLDEAGLSFNPYLDTGRPGGGGWRFDPVPVVLAGEDWDRLSAGAVQRARMIEVALNDLYGAQSLLSAGAIPPGVVFGGPDFIRSCARWDRPPRRRLFRYALDVARTADGRWVVLDDALDRPDGDGWALANRVAVGQAASDLFVETGARRLATHFAAMQEALEAETGAEGRMIYLTPGPGDSAYFSHAYLARYLGMTLVEPGDLAVRDGEAHVKTLEGLRRVDVVLRGAPSLGIDPLYAPGVGAIAPPGVVRAARLGRVIFANAIGSAALNGRALAPFSAALIRRLLGEEPVLEEAPCLWLGEPEAQAAWLADREGWRVTGLRNTSRMHDDAERRLSGLSREAAARLLAREGWRYAARRPVTTGVTPTLKDGRLEPAPWAMRLFVAWGPDGWRCMPGGLAFAAPGPTVDSLPWQGVSKDVWVVDGAGASATQPAASARLNQRRRTAHLRRTGRELLSRVADNLFWLGRYAERADISLRVLKVVIERMIDAPRRDAAPELLHTLLSLRLEDAEDAPRASLRERIVRLALDPAEANGVRQAVDSVYWNANSTRAHLSRDAWRDVGALHAHPMWKLPPEPQRALGLGAAVEEAIRALAAFAGASHENMTRNFAWRFLELGRRLQRGVQVAQMFRALVCAQAEDEPGRLLALLQLCDSFFAYRSRYLTTPEATPAIDLLILDESNPRSLAFQVAAMEAVLAELPRPTPYRNAEHRLVLRLLTELRTVDAAELGWTDAEGRRARLEALLTEAEESLQRVSDLVAKAYFAHAEPALTAVSAARTRADGPEARP